MRRGKVDLPEPNQLKSNWKYFHLITCRIHIYTNFNRLMREISQKYRVKIRSHFKWTHDDLIMLITYNLHCDDKSFQFAPSHSGHCNRGKGRGSPSPSTSAALHTRRWCPGLELRSSDTSQPGLRKWAVVFSKVKMPPSQVLLVHTFIL